MGNFCLAQSGSDEFEVDVPIIYGDILDRETRLLISMCQLSEQKYHLKPINISKRENTHQTYVKLNPT
jgi:hypothetical protein